MPREAKVLEPPDRDLEERAVVWEWMQHFWMDTDPLPLFSRIVDVCARSKYSLHDLESIYWNEVMPAVAFHLWLLPAPAWAGLESDALQGRVLKKHRFGKKLPRRWLHPYANEWWKKLRAAVSEKRESETVQLSD